MKRIEDLLRDSSALKSHLVSNLQDLNNSFSELINFGISLAQQIMPYLSDVRGSKMPFQFEHVLSLVRRTASGTVNKGSNAPSPWKGVSDYIANVLQQANALVPLTMEPGNSLKSMCSTGFLSLYRTTVVNSFVLSSHRNPSVGHSRFRHQGASGDQR
jgi:dynactin 1